MWQLSQTKPPLSKIADGPVCPIWYSYLPNGQPRMHHSMFGPNYVIQPVQTNKESV